MRKIGKITVLNYWEERILPQRTALMIIDMQKSFQADKNDFKETLLQTVNKIANIADMARKKRIPVIYTTQTDASNCDKEGSSQIIQNDSKDKQNRLCAKNDLEKHIINELSPKPGDLLINKRCHSALIGTELPFLLYNLNVNCLVLSGISTSDGLLCTALNAVDLGYYVTVLSDCVISFTKEAYQHGMWMMRAHMDVESSSKVMRNWKFPLIGRVETALAFYYRRAKRVIEKVKILLKEFV